ncbi:PREDICTED: uncharacterized protein LOC104824124 [Tarenaya hassleriana]|uniref:uncharacterized protein LOC104824124 n=1 Tax=Tarenaya hassleriana TaxID=28532 RepID=UPI00053C8C7A|nr:PREDICTED: uncharacterized protein LOC104824124 [Tarenaya hassleriana]
MERELARFISLSPPAPFSPHQITLLPLSPPSTSFRRRKRGGDDGKPLLRLSTAEAETRLRCRSRRRVRYEGEESSYGYNEEIAMLEMYSQSCRDEALIVNAIVDDEEVEVLIFKGFSSCLSQETAADPSRSVVPEGAVIKSIDRVRCPFDPSNLLYIEKGLSFHSFKSRFIGS